MYLQSMALRWGSVTALFIPGSTMNKITLILCLMLVASWGYFLFPEGVDQTTESQVQPNKPQELQSESDSLIGSVSSQKVAQAELVPAREAGDVKLSLDELKAQAFQQRQREVRNILCKDVSDECYLKSDFDTELLISEENTVKQDFVVQVLLSENFGDFSDKLHTSHKSEDTLGFEYELNNALTKIDAEFGANELVSGCNDDFCAIKASFPVDTDINDVKKLLVNHIPASAEIFTKPTKSNDAVGFRLVFTHSEQLDGVSY